MINIVDFGTGNIRALVHKLARHGIQANLSSSPESIMNSKCIILPGVGHFREAMNTPNTLKLIAPLNEKVLNEGIPILGICLGFQLFATHSEEGNCNGPGWINANVIKIDFTNQYRKLPVPNVGWANLDIKTSSPLFKNIPASHRFYFTHSYHMVCKDSSDIIATAEYGTSFTAAVNRKNIFGTQFHPEKSHKAGFKLLLNFISLNS